MNPDQKMRIEFSTDYYPFGQPMPERNFNEVDYKFGFNGKEKVDEISGNTGTDYDFGARMYDSRIGRWFSCDPLSIKYPDLSPYQFCANNPIIYVDPDGKIIRISFVAGGREAFINLINHVFSEKVQLQEVTDAMGYTNIKLVYKEGFNERDLTKSQQKTFEYINKLASNTKITVSATISDENEDDIWLDAFDEKEMKADEISDIPNGDYQLAMVFHFFSEQYHGQYPGSDYGNDGLLYDYSHDKALTDGVSAYGFKWIGVDNPDNQNQWEVDYIDGNNKYINTMRVNRADDGSYTYSIYNRAESGTDYSKIDYWTGAKDNSEKTENVRKHFEETKDK